MPISKSISSEKASFELSLAQLAPLSHEHINQDRRKCFINTHAVSVLSNNNIDG